MPAAEKCKYKGLRSERASFVWHTIFSVFCCFLSIVSSLATGCHMEFPEPRTTFFFSLEYLIQLLFFEKSIRCALLLHFFLLLLLLLLLRLLCVFFFIISVPRRNIYKAHWIVTMEATGEMNTNKAIPQQSNKKYEIPYHTKSVVRKAHNKSERHNINETPKCIYQRTLSLYICAHYSCDFEIEWNLRRQHGRKIEINFTHI